MENPIDLDAVVERLAARVVAELAPHLSAVAAEDSLIDEDQAAALLCLKPSTLSTWRSRGGGPPFVRLGDGGKPAVRYRRADLRSWTMTRRHAHTSHKIGAEGA